MSETVKNLISAIATGNAVETQNAFNTAMAEKISDKLEEAFRHGHQTCDFGTGRAQYVAHFGLAMKQQRKGKRAGDCSYSTMQSTFTHS